MRYMDLLDNKKCPGFTYRDVEEERLLTQGSLLLDPPS
jgi:hypothetical protein